MFLCRVFCFFSQTEMFSCSFCLVLTKENGRGPCGFQEWLSGVSASTRMKIEQGGSKALQTKIHVSCQEEKVLQGMSSGFWGSGRW